MADDASPPSEPAPTTPTEPSEPATPPEPSAPVDITQSPEFLAAVDQKVTEVVTGKMPQIRRSVRRELQNGQTAPSTPASDDPPATDTPEPDKPNGQSRRTKSEKRLDFRDAVADYGFDRPKRKRLEQTYLAEGGDEDVDEWIADYVEAMGLGKPQPGTQPSTPQPAPTAQGATTPAPPSTPAAPTGPPVSDKGGPSSTNDQLTEQNMEHWTDDHIARFRAEAAEAKEHPGRYVRKKMLESLRGKTLVFSRNK